MTDGKEAPESTVVADPGLQAAAEQAAGEVMLGGIVNLAHRLRSHWVPSGAEPTYRYVHGRPAYHAVCGVACVRARRGYVDGLRTCPDCERLQPGYVALPEPGDRPCP